MQHTYRLGLVAGLTLAALAPLSLAQTAATPADQTTTTTTTTTSAPTTAQTQGAAPASVSTEAAVQMQQYNVSDVPIEQQILPTSRPFTSVFGTEDNIMEVPRNVTIISRAQMDTIDIQDTTQFSKLTSSSYTDSNFGSPSNPSIRGQSADVFMNGMRQRIGESGDGMPIDFNIIESVNIVPGPATAVQGASAYVGGFVDMISKQPFFDATKGSVSYTVGSYDTNRWTLDVGGPINPTLAYRFSYSGENSDGFWDNWIKETTSLYAAIEWRPTKSYDMFVMSKAFWADYRENFGINRVTQALIDNGLYIPGTVIDNGTMAGPGNLENAINVGTGTFGADTIAYGTPVPVNYHETAQGPASHAHGMEYNSQVIQTLILSTEAKIVNNTMFSYTKRDTFNSDGYSEIVDPSWFVDNRTEFILTKPYVTINTGFEEKYQTTRAYDDFYFEPVDAWDLSNTSLRSDINSYLSSAGGGGFFSYPVPGFQDRYADAAITSYDGGKTFSAGFPSNSDTNDSDAEVFSPYFQSTWKLSESWNLVAGARMDILHVQSKDPFHTNGSASIEVGEPNVNVSLVDKISPILDVYVTGNYSQNYTGDLADGGGFGLSVDASGNPTIARSLFAEPSELEELGAKMSLADGKLFVSTDVFAQTRTSKPQAGPAIQYLFYGYELSLNYQPNKQLFATLGYSWINGSSPVTAATYPFQGYDGQQLPGGPPAPGSVPPQSSGRLRAPGQPLDTFNALASYTFTSGFGIESNIVVTSPINNDYQGFLVIPTQYSLDAEFFYKVKHWEVRLSGTNVTNRHNWEAGVATYGLEGIVPLPTAQVFATFKYIF